MSESILEKIFIVIGRMLGWGLLGAVCGMGFAFLTGLLFAPSYDPDNPLANEWYPVGVIVTMFFECCAGFVLGAAIAIAARKPSTRTKAILLAAFGAALGVGVLKLLPDQGDDALVLSTYCQGAGVVATLAVGALFLARSRHRPDARDAS